MKASFRNVEEERELIMFLGVNTSMHLQSKDFIELVLLENEAFEIYRSPLARDVDFEYNIYGFFINGNEMELSYNQEAVIIEPFQICYDFTIDKVIFETVIGLLVLCLLVLTGKVNQDHFIEILYRLKGYISKEHETQV